MTNTDLRIFRKENVTFDEKLHLDMKREIMKEIESNRPQDPRLKNNNNNSNNNMNKQEGPAPKRQKRENNGSSPLCFEFAEKGSCRFGERCR